MKAVRESIEAEARKLVVRHQKYARQLSEESFRRERRTGVPLQRTVHEPQHWTCDPGFNPYHVRAHATEIARAVERSLTARAYKPRPAVEYGVPKSDGSTRTVSVFQVADNAISRMAYKSLIKKNASILGTRCYAYRTDVTVHDAILHIASEVKGQPRIFVAEYDFRKYFDTISHDYLSKIIRDKMFFVSVVENNVIQAFLRSVSLPSANYSATATATRERGIPQGTSISLFLANAAALPLDRRLERLGVGFARYADDTVIWSTSYAEICRAVTELDDAASEMGVQVNLLKSDGISLLTPKEAPSEIKKKSSIVFLGHQIDADNVRIKDKKVSEIRDHISYLAYSNLLQPLIRNTFDPARIAPFIDRDYVVYISQLRGYLYGTVAEKQLRRHLASGTPLLKWYGLMGSFPTINDEGQLRELDGWLLATTYRTMRRRTALLGSAGHQNLPAPNGASRADLLSLFGQNSKGWRLDFRLPSFCRIAQLIRITASVYGPSTISNPTSREYQ